MASGLKDSRSNSRPNSQSTTKLLLSDCICPVCMYILIEPVTMPCRHELCLACYKHNVEETSLTCPMCRMRISTWARKAVKNNKLVDAKRWEAVKAAFPNKVQNRLDGKEDASSSEDEEVPFHPPVHLAEPGEIREEYEQELRKLREEYLVRQRAEREASERLILELQKEEARIAEEEKHNAERVALSDEAVAKELHTVLNENDNLSTPEIDSLLGKRTGFKAKVTNPLMERFLKRGQDDKGNTPSKDSYPYRCISPWQKDEKKESVSPKYSDIFNTSGNENADTISYVYVNSREGSRLADFESLASDTSDIKPEGESREASPKSHISVQDSEPSLLDVSTSEDKNDSSVYASAVSRASSTDSISQEMAHFKPIHACPLTPPRRLPGGRIVEAPVIRSTPVKLNQLLDMGDAESNLSQTGSPPIVQRRLQELAAERQEQVRAMSKGTSTSQGMLYPQKSQSVGRALLFTPPKPVTDYRLTNTVRGPVRKPAAAATISTATSCMSPQDRPPQLPIDPPPLPQPPDTLGMPFGSNSPKPLLLPLHSNLDEDDEPIIPRRLPMTPARTQPNLMTQHATQPLTMQQSSAWQTLNPLFTATHKLPQVTSSMQGPLNRYAISSPKTQNMQSTIHQFISRMPAAQNLPHNSQSSHPQAEPAYNASIMGSPIRSNSTKDNFLVPSTTAIPFVKVTGRPPISSQRTFVAMSVPPFAQPSTSSGVQPQTQMRQWLLNRPSEGKVQQHIPASIPSQVQKPVSAVCTQTVVITKNLSELDVSQRKQDVLSNSYVESTPLLVKAMNEANKSPITKMAKLNFENEDLCPRLLCDKHEPGCYTQKDDTLSNSSKLLEALMADDTEAMNILVSRKAEQNVIRPIGEVSPTSSELVKERRGESGDTVQQSLVLPGCSKTEHNRNCVINAPIPAATETDKNNCCNFIPTSGVIGTKVTAAPDSDATILVDYENHKNVNLTLCGGTCATMDPDATIIVNYKNLESVNVMTSVRIDKGGGGEGSQKDLCDVALPKTGTPKKAVPLHKRMKTTKTKGKADKDSELSTSPKGSSTHHTTSKTEADATVNENIKIPTNTGSNCKNSVQSNKNNKSSKKLELGCNDRVVSVQNSEETIQSDQSAHMRKKCPRKTAKRHNVQAAPETDTDEPSSPEKSAEPKVSGRRPTRCIRGRKVASLSSNKDIETDAHVAAESLLKLRAKKKKVPTATLR